MNDSGYFEISRPHPWLYAIKDRLAVYCWLVVGDKAALLFDAGYGIGDLPEAVMGITQKPLTIVLSHGHADHVLGADQFNQVYLHKADFTLYAEHSGPKWRQKAVDAIKLVKEPAGFDAESYLKREPAFLLPLEEGAVFDLGGIKPSAVHMPGHTAGSVGILIKEHKVLLTSDAANRATFMFLPESQSIPCYLETLRKAVSLDFTVHFAGHQAAAYPKSWFDKYITVAENALAGKGSPMTIPGFEEYAGTIVSMIDGPITSPSFCAVAYTAEKLEGFV
ncbi:MAG: MBL fold metallo-hydrolase [Clostridiales bacterium]|jgi:glyoxylase-like metal-dependent hydrolase (beta-lactamase superfamily II)|nr:MBL fold metallo-hydrolase [Clostridiales bacterium]